MKYSSERYYEQINNKKVICIDFDNTICLDEWPYIGPLIPGAKEVLSKLKDNGHKLILYTQRSSNYPICCKELDEYILKCGSTDDGYADLLTPAIEASPVIFDDVNNNTRWEQLTGDFSRKIFMDYLIDDHVVGTKRLEVINKFGEVCKIVDWFDVDRWCMSEGLYKDSAIKSSYHDYLKQIQELSQ